MELIVGGEGSRAADGGAATMLSMLLTDRSQKDQQIGALTKDLEVEREEKRQLAAEHEATARKVEQLKQQLAAQKPRTAVNGAAGAGGGAGGGVAAVGQEREAAGQLEDGEPEPVRVWDTE